MGHEYVICNSPGGQKIFHSSKHVIRQPKMDKGMNDMLRNQRFQR